MAGTLSDPAVRRVLHRLCELGAVEDPAAKLRVRERESHRGAGIYGDERVTLQRGAPLAISPEAGQLLYALTVARSPHTVVEFGASLGFSTICIASALRDVGAGSLVTTEVSRDKALALMANLVEAGLSDVVEVRVGDARQMLRGFADPVDLLFLDGANDLYLDLLRSIEPQLSERGLVVADMSEGDPHHVGYRQYVSDRRGGYATVEVPLDAGLVVSIRLSRLEPGRPG
jgi:predicted O-methyltransferase YrrM